MEAAMQKITPFLWFDHQAVDAADLYVSLFKKSKIAGTTYYGEAGPRPAGTIMTVTFQLEGQEFTALNGGPEFSITPAISFFVSCETKEEVDQLFQALSAGGQVFMPLDQYPFSERFAWVGDRFGVSWQLNLGPRAQKISPYFTFVGAQHGKVGEALNLYVSLFKDSGIQAMQHYPAGSGEPDEAVLHAEFTLAGQEFMAMDGGLSHDWTFNEGVSLFVSCESQAEVDALWGKLTTGGEEGPCGWLKDPYGVSWQIVPTVLIEMLQDKDAARATRVTQAMLQMKKIDIAGLQQAYDKA
jgi:predicted 3-demethylubiquinone-9 3-methyltransferase (glyoxalase superfamily)